MLGTLLGNYRIVQQLGQGGMGVVYVGRHEALGHRVVVKVLQPELSSKADMVRRFFNEARAATSIRSPGIVQVFDFGTTSDGRAYLVMEMLEGETLGARLRKTRYDPAACCRIGRQVANVLQAAHAAGITHRDLKPANLFLVPDPEVAGGERVKVLDFGIAKLAGEARLAGIKTTSTGLVMGTPHYMSPEQCRSASIADPRSDIYSLGCILFEIACGRRPFVFEGVGDIVSAHLHESPPHPQNLAPHLPAELSALIARMLAKHPDARPQTMAAVGQALDEILRMLDSPAAHAATLIQGLPAMVSPPGPPAPQLVLPPAAVPVLLPPPVPEHSSLAITLERWIRPFSRRREQVRRLTFALGAFVIVVAIAAIAVVLASARPGRAERLVSYRDIAAARPGAVVIEADAAIASPPAPSVKLPEVAPQDASPVSAADLEAECQQYQTDRKWSDLEQCADRLSRLDAKRAGELRARAVDEARAAPRIAAARAALRDEHLNQAKAELDQVWTASVDYASVKRAYDTAEAHEIDSLATQLDSVKDASCEAYRQLLAGRRADDPPRVLAEASRRSPCIPRPKCNADTLADTGRRQFEATHFAESLASYEAAYICRPDQLLLRGALVLACKLHNLPKARTYWKQLSQRLRSQVLTSCAGSDVTQVMLNSQ